jgi:N-acetylmuramic acid 6-phosphate etherase
VEATGAAAEECAAVLTEAAGDARVALVSLLSGVPVAEAGRAVAAAGGAVRKALELTGERS